MTDLPQTASWHSISAEETLNRLQTRISGLNEKQVEERRRVAGWNEIPQVEAASWLLLYVKQFNSLLVLILLVAAIISWFTGHKVDAFVILGIVLLNSIIGFTQEYRAEKAVASLRKILVHSAKVFRNGELVQIPSREIVPGDVIFLEEGDNIPADARVIESHNLRAVEASLTGESLPSAKNTEPLPASAMLADRKNMVWKGTFIAGGSARAVVTGTGMNTAIGSIARTISGIKQEPTNFQRKTKTLARQMAILAISSSTVLFITGYFIRKMELEEILIFTLAALVSAIPEGLPAILSIVLAIGAWRMTQRKAIIREFTATETLGAITAIITDKTGTLTQNSLTIKKIFIPGRMEYDVTGEGWEPVGHFMQHQVVIENAEDNSLQKLLTIAAYSNNSGIRHNPEKNSYEMAGDPTEGALHAAARKAGIHPNKSATIRKMHDLPFNSVNKFRATLCEWVKSGRKEVFVIGAPEKILELSVKAMTAKGEMEFTETLKEEIKYKMEEWSGKAMRVLALAYREVSLDTKQINEKDLNRLVFAGITGMLDPPRPDVKESVEKCRAAGIRVIMATGDHINTAIAIAKATGIVTEEEALQKETIALTEKQLAELNEQEFTHAANTISVFARLSPDMKLRIATRLQEQGELLAMTGDGVNDAPALRKADVGIAMGIMGTDVARDAAEVVLADDNFSTIVHAIEEGRIVFTNARQNSFFLLTTNFAEILTLISAIAVGLPLPLIATQILWINLVTDGTVGIALSTEPGHGDVLKEKPIRQKENILNFSVLPFLVINAAVMTSLALSAFYYFLPSGIEKARTAVFLSLVFTQLFNMFNMRSLKQSVFSIGIFSNKYINLALLVSFILQVSVVEIPFLSEIFRLQRLEISELASLLGMASIVLFFGEGYKWLTFRFKFREI